MNKLDVLYVNVLSCDTVSMYPDRPAENKQKTPDLFFSIMKKRNFFLSYFFFFLNSVRRQNVNKWSTLDKIREAHVSEVSSHATALAVLVPQWGPLAGPEPVWGEAAGGAEAAGTVPLGVALDSTQDAGGTLLWQKSSPPPQIKMCMSKQIWCQAKLTWLGFARVFCDLPCGSSSFWRGVLLCCRCHRSENVQEWNNGCWVAAQHQSG